MLQLIKRGNTTNPIIVSISSIDFKLKDFLSRGLYERALLFYFDELHPSGIRFVLPSVVKACAFAKCSDLGLQLHCISLKTGMDSNPVTSNSLLSMYDKFGDVQGARNVFDTMLERDQISWNAMVNCYIRNGFPVTGLGLVPKMYAYGFWLKPELLASVLSVCQQIGFVKAVHAIAVLNEMFEEEEESVFILTALVDVYMRLGESLTALRVFNQMKVRNEVTWSSMIARCCDNGDYNMAIDCLRAMQFEGIKPNRVTVVSVLSSCAEDAGAKQGREIHGYAFRHGFDSECCFSGALVHMYSHCGKNARVRDAKLIFDRVTEKDIFLWSSMIGLYSRRQKITDMMNLFNQMRKEGTEPNSVTLLSMISAFTSTSLINHGISIHGFAFKCGMNLETSVGNSLISMYAKTGCLEAAHAVFKDLPTKDSVSWTALIHAYALHGQGSEALRHFSEMKEGGFEPDQTSLLVVLSACNHAGLLEEAKKIFSYAKEEGNLLLTVEHYACYIDLLAKSGQLEDACNVVNSMPMEPSHNIWSSLISAFRNDGRFQEAEKLAHMLVKSKPDSANYTTLGSVYAEFGKWLCLENIRKKSRLRGLKKTPGVSRIELECGIGS